MSAHMFTVEMDSVPTLCDSHLSLQWELCVLIIWRSPFKFAVGRESAQPVCITL